MFNSNEFYRKRLSSHVKELSRYLRYIFNGHLMIVLFFLVSALAFYYQQWLQQIPTNFPAAWIIGTVFGLLVSYSPVRTLLKEPDLVFLIVSERKMYAYFRNSLIYSYVIQLYLIFLAAAALAPLYFAVYPNRTGTIYLLTIVILLIIKLGNLLANWWMLKVRDQAMRRLDITVRTLINILLFYFLVWGEYVFAAITTVIFMFLFLYDFQTGRKQFGLNWELLIEKDHHRMQTFYRLANMFTDVPHLKAKVKKRKWLVTLATKTIPFEKRTTYDYLYRITFIRSGDYIGMYVRLLIIGALAIYFIPNMWMKIAFSTLFIYLSVFQMMTLYQHHRMNMWLDLYPVKESHRQKALIKLLYQLGIIQIIIYGVIVLLSFDLYSALLTIGIGFAFCFLFMNGYVKRKIVS